MIKTNRNLAGQINATTCPTKEDFCALMLSLETYILHSFHIAIAYSEIIGLPANQRFWLIVEKASNSVGAMIAIPLNSSTAIYKSYITGGTWSDWIET